MNTGNAHLIVACTRRKTVSAGYVARFARVKSLSTGMAGPDTLVCLFK